MIAIVDVCSGNLRSVERALQHVGAEVVVTRDPDVVRNADKIVVPGQGAFARFMHGLVERGLEAPLRDAIERGVPYFGICLGLQVLFDHSEEGDVDGLGVLAGNVVRFRPTDRSIKVPHMGWNRVSDNTYYYFVHSYHAVPADRSIVTLEATHGIAFCAAVRTRNIFAVQFHPEKSQAAGLALLRDFA
ncbi:MAG TPA: imidazole glycerol phosphate synthase subunit HisH [Kofleriaceae bacterium]